MSKRREIQLFYALCEGCKSTKGKVGGWWNNFIICENCDDLQMVIVPYKVIIDDWCEDCQEADDHRVLHRDADLPESSEHLTESLPK